MENAFIFLGIGGFIWIFTDIMKRGKKPETSPAEPEPAPAGQPPPNSAFQKLFRTATGATGAGSDYMAEVREISHIARMYDAMRPVGAPAFFDLPDAEIMAILQRYKREGGMIHNLVLAFLFLCMLFFSVLMGAGMLKDAGMIDGFFTDKADEIRAETALKRVDVELLKQKAENEEKRILIEKATEPRTPMLTSLCLAGLIVLCGALFMLHMRERERRRFSEYQLKMISGRNQKPLPSTHYSTKLPAPDARDRERGMA